MNKLAQKTANHNESNAVNNQIKIVQQTVLPMVTRVYILAPFYMG